MTSYTYSFIELGEEHALGCKCCRFSNGIDLPVPKKLSDTEIATHATKFSHTILANWTKLNAILKRFEGVIQKRWLKKTNKQKRELLLKAQPSMPASHRPDFMGFRNTDKTAPRSRTTPSAAFLWPYINLEDLQQHHLLLLFLNSRGRNLPDLFITADVDGAHVGEGWKDMGDGHAHMLLNGQRTPRTYGKLKIGKERKCNCDKPCIWYPPNSGILLLEIQEGIYTFLLACAKLILHDVDPNQFFTAPHQPQPTLPEMSLSEWPSLTANALEASYRVPQKLNLDRLTMMVGARRASAEDHIWMLREDPGYFIETLREWKEHSAMMLKHVCTSHWKAVAADMIADAQTYLIFWDWIYRCLAWMPSIESQLRRADPVSMRLPPKEEAVWVELLQIVDFLMFHPIMRLREGMRPSPRMRHCYNLSGEQAKSDSWPTQRRLTAAERRVDLLFYAIGDPEQSVRHGINHLVQEVQYMLDSDADANQLVDSWLVGQFSDLAMLSELRSRIDGLEPYSTGWSACKVHETKQVEGRLDKIFGLESKARAAIFQACGESRVLGIPIGGALEYPASKSYTEANTKQMRSAERRLDAFWVELEVRAEKKFGVSLFGVLERRLCEPRTIQRTPEWVPPLVPQMKMPVLGEVATNIPRFRETFSSTHTPLLIKQKTKIKTRGSPSPAPTTPEVAPAPADDNNASPKVKLPKRAYKVFAALLPETNAEHHQRIEIAWDELLHAMNAIGLQPEKLYGSVWMFKPKIASQCKIEMKRSIQFHEPKEVRKGSKIPQNMVRTFGRRLKHAYGWEGGMFVCG